MDTGKQPGKAAPQSPHVDARPVVLVLVEDTIGSVAPLLLAAEIAAVWQARLHIAYVSAPRIWWGTSAALAIILLDADRAGARALQDRVGDLLALRPPVEWTFTWTPGMVHRTVKRLVSDLSPIAVVVGEPRRPRLSIHRSTARWLIGRFDVQAVVVPA
jgi:hypothetical protein